MATDPDIAASGGQFFQFCIVAAGFQKAVIAGAPVDDDHPPDDQLTSGFQVIVGEIEPQAFKCRQLQRPPITQARVFKVDVLFVEAAYDRIVSTFKGKPIDDDRYFFLVDPFIDVFQICKIFYLGAEAELLGCAHQTFRSDPAGFGATGYFSHFFFSDFNTQKTQHHF